MHTVFRVGKILALYVSFINAVAELFPILDLSGYLQYPGSLSHEQ